MSASRLPDELDALHRTIQKPSLNDAEQWASVGETLLKIAGKFEAWANVIYSTLNDPDSDTVRDVANGLDEFEKLLQHLYPWLGESAQAKQHWITLKVLLQAAQEQYQKSEVKESLNVYVKLLADPRTAGSANRLDQLAKRRFRAARGIRTFASALKETVHIARKDFE